MDEFLSKHQNEINGTLSMYDRVIFKGHLTQLFMGDSFKRFLDKQGVLLKDFKTYATNTRLKAQAFAVASGLLTLADDSGLEVDALRGAPGVLSSRYASPGTSDSQRVDYLLSKLVDVLWEQRTARFRCVMALCAGPGCEPLLAEGRVEGRIAFAPAGAEGFGYDPIFYLPERGCTLAQLPAAEKNRLSHRYRALAALGEKLLRSER